MKLPFRQATQRYLLWGIGLSVAHAGTAYGLSKLVEWTDGILFESGIPTFLMDERVHVVREFALTGLTLLHLPLAILVAVLGPGSYVWILSGIEPALFGFGIATLVCWLNRPPALFAKFQLPLITRQAVALTLLLAAAHVLLSAFLYFSWRFATATGPQPRWTAADEALALLHPWLYLGRLRPYAPAEPTVVVVALFDALVWGFVATLVLSGLRWAFVYDRKSRR